MIRNCILNYDVPINSFLEIFSFVPLATFGLKYFFTETKLGEINMPKKGIYKAYLINGNYCVF